MMDNARYQAELGVLQRKLPSNTFKFMDMNTSHPYLVVAAKTNSGKVYTIRIDLDLFPTSIPKAFVTKMLYSKAGTPLNSASATMHTLTSEYGYTRICHYGSQSWTQNVSLYKVYVKCRLWLEVYERHLKTGENLDVHLTHQR